MLPTPTTTSTTTTTATTTTTTTTHLLLVLLLLLQTFEGFNEAKVQNSIYTHCYAVHISMVFIGFLN